jgi:hypothetical protein|tara:strand:+ start:4143 stop:4640 length:498 start_codon:yes stop_codon:yes gene_type:complete
MNYLIKILVLILATLSLAYADEYQEVSWDDLMPADWVPNVPEDQAFFEGETLDGTVIELPKTEFAPIVKVLDKQKLKLPGYMIPIKFNTSSVSEFLLVPYLGACIHTPPPPENQIVYVSLKKPLVTQDLWAPVWVSGTMKAQLSMTKYATAGYHMMEATTEVYEY